MIQQVAISDEYTAFLVTDGSVYTMRNSNHGEVIKVEEADLQTRWKEHKELMKTPGAILHPKTDY